jgi:hypothetical protein
MPDDPAPGRRDIEGLFFRECEHAGRHVGVVADAVRVDVVAAMLSDPPGKAQPHDAVEECERQQPVGVRRPEDLVVSGIVRQEADLAEREGQEARDGRLPRRRHRARDQHPGGGHDDHRRHDPPQVPARRAPQQSRGRHSRLQAGEGVRLSIRLTHHRRASVPSRI